jgi:GNAT superfamily N-acetyltransferase
MHIRLAEPELDIPGILDIVNAFEREPLGSDAVAKWFEHMPPGRIAHRIVAIAGDGQVIGYGVATHETWSPDHQFYVWIGVAPPCRGHGVGSALYEEVSQFLNEQGAVRLTSEVRDDDSQSQKFAKQNGFETDRHLFASRIDLNAFDEAIYASLFEDQKASGIRFHTLADFPNNQEAKQKLYEINSITALDIPGASGTYMSFEDFEQWVCSAKWYRPDGQIIAVDRDKWIGLSAVQLMSDTHGAYNLITGVLKSHRGRKIAQALKVLALSYARKHGASYMSTDNDSLNIPMLAINKKYGYVPEPGKFNLIKKCNNE